MGMHELGECQSHHGLILPISDGTLFRNTECTDLMNLRSCMPMDAL